MCFNRPLASTIIWNSRQHPVNIGWLRKRYLVIILYLLVSQIISLANSSLQQHAIYDILPFLACIPNCVNLNFKGWWPRLTPEPCWDWSLLELGGIGWNSWKYSKVHSILIRCDHLRDQVDDQQDHNVDQVDDQCWSRSCLGGFFYWPMFRRVGDLNSRVKTAQANITLIQVAG